MRLILLLFVITGCSEKPSCKTVNTIGGCDDKYCGVRFRDGSYGTAKYPVRGRRMCVDDGIYYPQDI